MRCPRCSFEGELIDGACPQCGYRRVSISEGLRNAGSSGSGLRPSSAPLRQSSAPLRSPSMPLRGVSGPLRSPSISDGLRSPSMPLQTSFPSTPFPSSPVRSLSLYTAKSGDTLSQGRYRLVDQLILPDNQQGQGAAWLAVDNSAGQAQVVIREIVVPADELVNKKQIARQVALRLSEGAQHNISRVKAWLRCCAAREARCRSGLSRNMDASSAICSQFWLASSPQSSMVRSVPKP